MATIVKYVAVTISLHYVEDRALEHIVLLADDG